MSRPDSSLRNRGAMPLSHARWQKPSLTVSPQQLNTSSVGSYTAHQRDVLVCDCLSIWRGGRGADVLRTFFQCTIGR
ncbi:hypothetical protein PsYK624_015370 [Phanerochaete sordida]|uniref:Uncharacterized protein n=1 Tax=Phanerochaete sordida TaxID=48140 RepID=A0A9P3FYB4_9APHY|nr:hypothetical protein PsYK624_015370 [Phanerochaete sordida]